MLEFDKKYESTIYNLLKKLYNNINSLHNFKENKVYIKNAGFVMDPPIKGNTKLDDDEVDEKYNFLKKLKKKKK